VTALKWYNHNAANPPRTKALADARHGAARDDDHAARARHVSATPASSDEASATVKTRRSKGQNWTPVRGQIWEPIDRRLIDYYSFSAAGPVWCSRSR
jgi:hypothetical protein